MAGAIPRYRWRTFAPHGEAFHHGHLVKTPARPTPWHRHDFAEICWVEAGAGWHGIAGPRGEEWVRLGPGDVLLVRADDAHAFKAGRGETLTLTNVAFPSETLGFLRARYFPDETRWFWAAGAGPGTARVESQVLAWLAQAGAALALAPRERFPLERFLLNALHELGAHRSDTLPEGLPDWLAEACRAVREPEAFRRGTAHFFRLAGKSPEHVARIMRAQFGQTPTDYLNRCRLEHACFQLRMTALPVTQVAYDCGFENLSHFFHLFRRRFGSSPRAYRSAHRGEHLPLPV